METVKACLEIIWGCQYNIKHDQQRKPPLRFWALENPHALLNWFLGHPVFIFNPYEFGNPYKKKTCLWGYFNIPKSVIHPRAKNCNATKSMKIEQNQRLVKKIYVAKSGIEIVLSIRILPDHSF